jgi:hypothetical protein
LAAPAQLSVGAPGGHFFAIYLPDFLAHRFGMAFHRLVLPEFPVRTSLVNPADTGFGSFKIDYLALAADRSRAVFIELKTDCGSLREEQHAYLRAARERGLRRLLEDVLSIAQRSAAKQKYGRLVLLLQEIGLVTAPASLADRIRIGSRGLNAELRATRVVADCPTDIAYIQPVATASQAMQITFDDFANWLDVRAEPLANRFADSLRRWSTNLAGNEDLAW